MGAPPGRDVREGLRREGERVADRLDRAGARLAADDGRVRRVHDLLQALADRTADVEGAPRRRVPELAPHAWGDQVRLLAHDLLAAPDDGWPAGEAALEELTRALVELRRAL